MQRRPHIPTEAQHATAGSRSVLLFRAKEWELKRFIQEGKNTGSQPCPSAIAATMHFSNFINSVKRKQMALSASVSSSMSQRLIISGFILLLTARLLAGHAVQLRMAETATGAEAFKASLEGEFPGALFVETTEASHRVCLGHFDKYVDALLVKNAIREDSRFSDAFIREVNEFPISETNSLSLIPSLFCIGDATASDSSAITLAGNAVYEALEVIDAKGDDSAYRRALLEAFPNYGQNDPVRGYIQTNLGILELEAGNRAIALHWLQPVATGEVASAASHRVMAMLRVAWLVHQAGDRLKAYQAYREVAAYTSITSVRARCLVECAGLLMELAESGKGSHDDVRAEINDALAVIAIGDTARRATLELMYSETYGRQKDPDYARAAHLSEEFVAKYSPIEGAPKRELATAMYQAGMYHRKAGDLESSLKWYKRVLTLESADGFAGLDPKSQAMFGLAKIAEGEGNNFLSLDIQRDIIELFPHEQIASQLLSKNPSLRSVP